MRRVTGFLCWEYSDGYGRLSHRVMGVLVSLLLCILRWILLHWLRLQEEYLSLVYSHWSSDFLSQQLRCTQLMILFKSLSGPYRAGTRVSQRITLKLGITLLDVQGNDFRV